MKKMLLIVFTSLALSLSAVIEVHIPFEHDMVGDGATNPYISPEFEIENTGDAMEYSFDIEYDTAPDGWFMTWCNFNIEGIGDGCHHHSMVWTETIPSGTFQADFQVNGLDGTEGMVEFDFIISGGDLAEPLVLPFSFRTTNFVSNDDQLTLPLLANVSNYPNPFNPETTISFDVTERGNVSVDIFNLRGQLVKNIFSGERNIGTSKFVWNGLDNNNKAVASGVYYLTAKSKNNTIRKKMLLLK